MTGAPRVLVIVPAHDEREALPGVLRELRAACGRTDVVLVDDGSTDGSGAIGEALGARVITHPRNRGYGAALVSGYRYALEHGYDLVVTVDGDGQHDPSQIDLLLLAADHADVVIGSRMIRPGGEMPSFPRRVGIRVFAALGRALTPLPITDPTSGFTAVRRRALPFLVEHTPEDFPDLNVLIALERAGYVLREVPVTMRARRTGQSMNRGLVPFLYVAKMLWYVYREARRPHREPTRAHGPAESKDVEPSDVPASRAAGRGAP